MPITSRPASRACLATARASAGPATPLRLAPESSSTSACSGPADDPSTGERGWRVRGAKPERCVRQTDFSNEEAVGFLADRLNRIGVEVKLAQMGAQEGDTVLIGAEDNSVVFDFKPSVEAGAEMLGRRGEDERLREARPARDRRREIAEGMETKADEEARADVARRLDEDRRKKGPNRSSGSSGVGPMAYEIGSKDDPDWDGSDD